MNISDLFNDPVAIATLVLALVTVFLAIGTFLTIRQNRKFRKKERKERLLNEVIEWAIDVPNYGLKYFSNYAPLIDNDRGKRMYHQNILLELHALNLQGEYIKRISYVINSEFGNLVQELRNELTAHINNLEQKIIMDYEADLPQRKHLSVNAIKVLEVANGIKAKLIE